MTAVLEASNSSCWLQKKMFCGLTMHCNPWELPLFPWLSATTWNPLYSELLTSKPAWDCGHSNCQRTNRTKLFCWQFQTRRLVLLLLPRLKLLIFILLALWKKITINVPTVQKSKTKESEKEICRLDKILTIQGISVWDPWYKIIHEMLFYIFSHRVLLDNSLCLNSVLKIFLLCIGTNPKWGNNKKQQQRSWILTPSSHFGKVLRHLNSAVQKLKHDLSLNKMHNHSRLFDKTHAIRRKQCFKSQRVWSHEQNNTMIMKKRE